MAKKTRKKYPAALKAKVLRDYKKGTRVVDLAKQYGASVPTLYLWLRKGGISRAAKSGPKAVMKTGSPRLVKGLQLRVKRLELEVKRQRKRQLKLVRVLKRSLEQSFSAS